MTLVGIGLAVAVVATPAAAEPFVELQTSSGRIVLELRPELAPQTVANFLTYVDEGFYAGTVIHRTIPGFMVQGGGYDEQLRPRPTHAPIDNEAATCVKNLRGTVAMARSMDPHSTTSQFFINVEDNHYLNHVRPERGYEGYCAFARVVEGMEVADRMSRVATGPGGIFDADVPLEPLLIAAASRVEGPFRMATRANVPDASRAPARSTSLVNPKDREASTMMRRALTRRSPR
jgi:peptidyl-prolyl cis-trans isomerase A (cyclophilin A)/peptidyl-prolyl cis-trans isomerase B (cyclophilin B)